MVLYTCGICNFSSTIKTHYKRHLKTKKHERNLKELPHQENIFQNNPQIVRNNPQIVQNNPQIIQNIPVAIQSNPATKKTHEKYKCDHCDEEFTLLSNKRRHELHRCKKNIKSFSEIEKNEAILKIEKRHENEKKLLYKQIELLLSKVGNTTNHITNNTQNIQLNHYGNEDLSHISDSLKASLIKMPYRMIPKLIEAVHFNQNKPENKNILLANKNDNKIKIFDGNKWIYKNKEETLNDLVDGKYLILDTYYEQKSNSLEQISKNNYEKFRNIFDEKDKKLIEQLKNECELILLNNR